jgi:hypothetical protein
MLIATMDRLKELLRLTRKPSLTGARSGAFGRRAEAARQSAQSAGKRNQQRHFAEMRREEALKDMPVTC